MLRKAKKNRKREEKNKKYEELFDTNDVNGDGVLSPSELRWMDPTHACLGMSILGQVFRVPNLEGLTVMFSESY